MNTKLPFLITIILFLSFQCSIFSQRKRYKTFEQIDGFSITPKLGLASMIGELGEIGTMNPILGIGVEKGISEKFNIGFEIVGGNLSGSENQIYNARFKTDFFQIQTLGILNISQLLNDYKIHDFEIKAYSGGGLIWFHTDVYDFKSGKFLRTTADGTTQHTQLFQQAGAGIGEKGIFYTRELVVPIGLFLDWRFGERLGIVANLGYNWVYNDKLDATNPYSLQNPNIIGGVNSYSETANDGWLNISLGLKYRFKSAKFKLQRGV